MDEALAKAKTAIGGAAALAARLNIRSQAVSQWKRVPVGRVLDVERATGVSRHELRPDIYGEAAGHRVDGTEPVARAVAG